MLIRSARRDSKYGGTLPRRATGFSLVELMVAMALSLILLAGVLAIFASSRTTYETTDRLSRIQESGRFALDMIVRDLRTSGYRGCSRSVNVIFTNSLNSPNALLWNFSRIVEGFDAQGSGWAPALDVSAGGAYQAVPGSDVLVIRGPTGDFSPVRVADPLWRMTATTDDIVVANVSPPVLEAGDVVQIDDCEGRSIFQITANTGGVLSHAPSGASASGPGNSSNDLGYAFTGYAELMPVQTAIYYLRAGSTPGGGTSLWRRVSGPAGAQELVEGVEAMQILYGQEVAGNVSYRRADQVTNWDDVLTVRVALLVRSMSEYGTDVGPNSYDVLGVAVANPGDRHMRQVFTTTVTIRNHAS